MSDAIKKLHDYLAMSPSVVYPEDVLAYLPAIEDENAKLREQYETVLADYRSEVAKLRKACAELLKMAERHDAEWLHWPEMHEELRELGVEVD